jgi:hypothetical protein
MEIGWTGLTLTRVPRESAPGYTVETFPLALQKQIIADYEKKYPPHSGAESLAATEKYVPPKGYSDSRDHFRNFFDCVRTRKQPVEDAMFGYRAAGAALLSNLSVERGQAVKWDPEAMKLVS